MNVPIVYAFSRSLSFSATGCFLPGDNMCGNRLLDEGEDCDCGSDQLTTDGLCMDDACCNGTSCRLATDRACRSVWACGVVLIIALLTKSLGKFLTQF